MHIFKARIRILDRVSDENYLDTTAFFRRWVDFIFALEWRGLGIAKAWARGVGVPIARVESKA